jgi:hypothetical protein
VEFQPPTGSTPLTNGSARPTTGAWPTVPPAPTPVKPTAPAIRPEPPLIRSVRSLTGSAPPTRQPTVPQTVPPTMPPTAAPSSGRISAVYVDSPNATDDSPTVTIPTPPQQPAAAVVVPTRESPILHLRGALPGQPRSGRPDLAWQPRFAYGTAGVVLGTLFLLTLPLWVVLFRMTDPAANNGAGPNVGSLLALCMMLMGVFLTGAATWMIMIEMRARVRIVDALAGIRERELTRYPPDLDPTLFDPARWGLAPDEMNQPVTAPIPAGAGAHQVARLPGDPASTLGTARMLASVNGVLRSSPKDSAHGPYGGPPNLSQGFGQLPAQIALLAVALALFVGAIILGS